MKVEPCSVRLQGHALESIKAYVLAKRISLRPLTWGLPSSLHPLSFFLGQLHVPIIRVVRYLCQGPIPCLHRVLF
jgi:hypothetical protein